MYATAAETNIDVLLVSELSRGTTTTKRWNLSLDNSCAIILTLSANLMPSSTCLGYVYSWVIIGPVLMASCYCSPNCSPFEFFAFLNEMECVIHKESGPTSGSVLAGYVNFNSRGSSMLDYKSQAHGDVIGSLGLPVENIRTILTFSGRNQNSIINVTVPTRVRNWG